MGARLSAVMPTPPLGTGLFLGRKCQGRRLPSALCQGGWKDGLGCGGELRGRGIFRLLPSGELLSLIPSDLFLRLTKSLPFPGRLWGLGSPQWPLSFRNFPWLSSPCCFLAVGWLCIDYLLSPDSQTGNGLWAGPRSASVPWVMTGKPPTLVPGTTHLVQEEGA